ncbi:MAG: gephyrin-like molybdotransferase Glp [Rhodospirillales bacterium]
MAQLSDDCFAFGGPLMSMTEALALLAARTAPVVGTETVGLRRAGGRILAADVLATGDVPPVDNAAVDGYAVRHADLDPATPTRLPVTGRAAAGHALGRAAGPGEAIRIFTGAAMPAGCDTVAMQEDCTVDGDHVIVAPGLAHGANRRRAGEDIRAGATVLAAGRRLRPQDIGLAAAVGAADLVVYQRLRTAVFSTGDELRDPGDTPPAGCIYDSNRYGLMAMLEGLGCAVDDLGILPDRLEAIGDALAAAAAGHHLIATSGGMSVGEEDHVKAAVEAGGSLYFWRLAIKPGRPLGLGRIGGVPFVGLPGNPVAMMVTFMRVARPVILRLGGCTELEPHLFRVPADFAHRKKTGRREWVRARLAADGDGRLVARKFGRDGAGILSSMVEADGLVELPEDLARLEPGTLVDFLPFDEVSH